MANDQWFYSKGGQKNGPVAGSVLKQLARSGELVVSDLVWREGMSEWAPASKLKGLFPESVVAAAPPPSPASPLAVADAPTKNLDERYGSIYRSSDQKVLLGLCGGLAHKFGLPPAVVRVIAFFVPFGIVAYIAGFFLPKLPTKGVPTREAAQSKEGAIKKWNWKKIAISAGVLVVALVAFDVTGRFLFPEKWAELDKQREAERQASAERRQEKAAENAKRGQPTGAMYMGGIVAIEMANAGAMKPTSNHVNALARAAATKSDVHDPNERSRFVRDFEFGFWKGWKTATR